MASSNINETSDIPDDAPEHCPGTESEQAGQVAACEGCPNQNICSAAKPSGPDPDVAKLVENMTDVQHKILILSGKGGVGKSTVTSQLAFGLASINEDDQVAVLDIDICGPSIPKVMGLEGEEVHQSGAGWSPVYVADNLGVMSIGFLLNSPDDAVIWRGPKKNGIIKQFLKDVDWGNVDYMLVDTPPGTSDEHISIAQYLKASGISGAIIVTTPQEVALIDVRKEINFCKKVDIPIIGVLENMAGFVCPKCQTETQIFAPSTGGAEKMAHDMNVTFLGSIPLDPRIGQCCDSGQPFIEAFPESPAAKLYITIIDKIKIALNKI